ncbi:Uncharacterized protein AXF42_Ash012146 [Apostasia shenzhenica]|uniref:Non-specific serine/threonine protein kinase n=1 Tax=Apostasia shenzhenica TaxID=1088818 RepID=A0A2I0B437_9ASPA|nr:Uncharacterized protein AXF42_Ash012146 [Apostasia shenzhenica]
MKTLRHLRLPPKSLLFLHLLLLLFLFLISFPCINALNLSQEAISIGIGIGIGGGGPSPSEPQPNCPPPPTPPSPPPPSLPPVSPPPIPQPPPKGLTPGDFENILQYRAYKVIQRFKRTIYCDPKKIIGTWRGANLRKYKGFFLETPPRFKNNTPTVASVDFNGFTLCSKSISGFIDQLPDLALFHANSNGFGGTVPSLTGLQYLYELDLSNNKLSGSFPSAVLPLNNLRFLDIRYNFFAGAVSPIVFFLPVEVLFLNNNGFSQPLPVSLGRTTAKYLTLANNGFTGPIPKSIGFLSSTLIEVLFLNNRLSGCLPSEIGQLRKTTVFDAGFNEITGTIPLSFACLVRVEQLNLAGNLLYGEVPDEVCRLGIDGGGHLLNLSLSSNYFTSIGYSCWKLLWRGLLDLRKNCIPGVPQQRPAAECARFFIRKHYFCPLLNDIPCYHNSRSSGGDSSPAAAESGHSSYAALGKVVGH